MSEFGRAHTVQRIGVLGAGFAGLWDAIGAARKLDEIGIGPEQVEVSPPGDQETARPPAWSIASRPHHRLREASFGRTRPISLRMAAGCYVRSG